MHIKSLTLQWINSPFPFIHRLWYWCAMRSMHAAHPWRPWASSSLCLPLWSRRCLCCLSAGSTCRVAASLTASGIQRRKPQVNITNPLNELPLFLCWQAVALKSFFFLPTAMKRRFEFNLSFQQGYGVYKLSHATMSYSNPHLEKPAYHSLFNCDFPNTRLDALESGGLPTLGPDFDFSTTCPVDSSSHADLLLEAVAGGGERLAECPSLPHENNGDDGDFSCVPSLPSQDHNLTDASSVFEGTERRLSHKECRKIELTDWEWCRSKSERTPRQVHQSRRFIIIKLSRLHPSLCGLWLPLIDFPQSHSLSSLN